ncbi:MAG: hypothetical protein FWD22_05665 [Treponema sp.]|nr:hypothetical protein [Treponema sp.]
MNSNEIIIDEKSGISAEEQREILNKINSITENNRRLLSQAGQQTDDKKGKIVNAKKNGAIFPLAVNIAALVLLAGGIFLIIFLNSRTDSQLRVGKAVYDLTERTLIEEIRKDTAEKIAAKEMEMATISSRMQEVDDQLLLLYSSNQELTAEQIAAQERLLAMQNAFREELNGLQDERSRILEASRSREARLRAQLDERTREFAAAQQRTSGELDLAMSELDRLTSEQERINAIDAQVSGGLAAANEHIGNGQYDKALQVAGNLRHFCNNNSLSSLRSFQARREFYNQTIDFMEAMILDARVNSGSGGGAEQFELMARNVQLQDNISELQKTIDALSSGGTGLTRRIGELEEVKTQLENTVEEKDSKISSLETENSGLQTAVTDLRTNNTRLEQETARQEQRIADLNTQLAAIRLLLQDN